VHARRELQKPAAAAHKAPRPRYVLFICAANTARSVMAEHMLRRELERRGAAAAVSIASAGIAPFARDGALVSLDTRLVLREEGIHLDQEATATDLKRHPELLEAAEVVITMTRRQAEELRQLFPAAAERPVYTIRSFAGQDEGDIEDPFEKGDIVFAAVREQIKLLIPAVADRILGADRPVEH
jgi:protein-tyrosine-phosphatase